MKIGFSFGRCVRDIVEGKVNIDDVMVIVARTYMTSEEDVECVIQQYHSGWGPLNGLDYDACKNVGLTLFKRGKLHQPRIQGSVRYSVADGFVWMDLVPTDLETTNESVKDAWDQYQMMLRLAGEALPDPDYAPTN